MNFIRSARCIYSFGKSARLRQYSTAEFDICGKIGIVTGGAEGIGIACATKLLESGVKAVTIADIDECKGEEAVKNLNCEFPDKVIFIKTDCTKPCELGEAFKKSMDKWKAMDIVINNAGVLNDGQWEMEITLNCMGMVRGTLLGLQYMGKDKCGKGGVIVNLASILGLQPLPGCPVYVGTKHFIVGFDRSLGSPYHFCRTGVKILTMCPGVTATPLISDANKNAFTELDPNIGKQLAKELGALPPQPTENVACGMITLITKGESGSVWVSEGNEPLYEIDFPDRQSLRKC